MEIVINPIGYIRSELTSPANAPMQGSEGAPDAWLEINENYRDGLKYLNVNDDIILLTWLHLAERDVLLVYPRDDKRNPLSGVFATRSPHRPNPIGLHPVKVLEISGTNLKVGPLEAVNGTPIIDIKPVLKEMKKV